MGGIVLSTAVQALYYRLDISKPWEQASTTPAKPVRNSLTPASLWFALSMIKYTNMSYLTDSYMGGLHWRRPQRHISHQAFRSFHPRDNHGFPTQS